MSTEINTQYWIIYMYTNTFNGKKYIGLTKRGTSKRNFDHVKKAREGKGNAFHAAIRKYGMDSWKRNSPGFFISY